MRENALLDGKEGGVPIAGRLKQMADPKFAAKHGIQVRSAADSADEATESTAAGIDQRGPPCAHALVLPAILTRA